MARLKHDSEFLKTQEVASLLKSKKNRKSSVMPLGACLISGSEVGGLTERGCYEGGGWSTKLDDKEKYDSFPVLLTHILRIQHTILRVKNINSTQFHPIPYQIEHANFFS